MAANKQTETAIFGGGCFWGMEKWYKKEFGASNLDTDVGYLGGSKENPSYKEVCTGNTGHAEVLQIKFDPKKVSFEKLVEYFFRIHDPTTLNRQGNDRGSQYRSAIFYTTEDQKSTAEKVMKEVQSDPEKMKHYSGSQIVTEITKASTFWRAEDYHQDYLDTNPTGYCNHKPRLW